MQSLRQYTMGFYSLLVNAGAKAGQSMPSGIPSIRSCNHISLALGLSMFLFFMVSYLAGGPSRLAMVFVAASAFSVLPIGLNGLGLTNLSRLALSVYLPLFFGIGFLFKQQDAIHSQGYVLPFYILQLVVSVSPFVFFRLHERAYWVTAALINLGLLLGMGWADHSHMNAHLSRAQPLSIAFIPLSFGLWMAFAYITKATLEKLVEKNKGLARSKFQDEIHRLQEDGKMKISLLQKELEGKGLQLALANRELIRHNHETLQFSYTISHNLRGPVASLQGLISLLNREGLRPEEREILGHIQKSIFELESIVKDLGNIVDVRFALTPLKQHVDFNEEVTLILNLLKSQLDECGATVTTDFQACRNMITFKPMLNSIFYNLISNAIKFRSPDRLPVINICSKACENVIVLRFDDNGLGIDLDRHKDHVFGLYKRFHTHTEGKGLGLFLTKLQLESMGGAIEVESLPGKGTTFTVSLAEQAHDGDQVLLDNDLARIVYKAPFNSMASEWKRGVSLDEFQGVFIHVVEFMKNYRLPNWIVDIVHTENNDEERFNQVRKKYYHTLKTYGMKRMAIIMPLHERDEKALQKRRQLIMEAYDLDFSFFKTMEEACQWIDAENKKNNGLA